MNNWKPSRTVGGPSDVVGMSLAEREWAALEAKLEALSGLGQFLTAITALSVPGGLIYLGLRLIILAFRLARVSEVPESEGPAWLPPRDVRRFLAGASFAPIAWPAGALLLLLIIPFGEGAVVTAVPFIYWGAFGLTCLVLLGALIPLLLRSIEFGTMRARAWLTGVLVALGVGLGSLLILPPALIDIPLPQPAPQAAAGPSAAK